ncbi:hypothetical protein JW799_17985 [Cohnella algarum]|nr:hypothetical protein [Cohnella algarum]MBN2983077.1 hypothetical protein [Cohnella algarum]
MRSSIFGGRMPNADRKTRLKYGPVSYPHRSAIRSRLSVVSFSRQQASRSRCSLT